MHLDLFDSDPARSDLPRALGHDYESDRSWPFLIVYNRAAKDDQNLERPRFKIPDADIAREHMRSLTESWFLTE